MEKQMEDTNAEIEERTDCRTQILRELPGFHLNTGEPCLCGAEHIRTRSKCGYSDSMVFYHRCAECGTEFSTWIEG